MPADPEGFWFDHSDSSLRLARSGNQVRLAHAVPPWIVVDQSIATLTIGSGWPGQLWRVRVTQLGDMSGLVAQPGYWRAAAIELREAMPLAALFGPDGDAVVDILEKIGSLSRVQAQQLGASLAPNAWAAYGRAWIRWSEGECGPGSLPESAGKPKDAGACAEQVAAWRGVLAASRRQDKDRSPLHSGLALIHTLLRQRAQVVDGANAVVLIEDDGETEEMLAPTWRGACHALLCAAMGMGATQYVSRADAAELTQAWRGVFGGQAVR